MIKWLETYLPFKPLIFTLHNSQFTIDHSQK